MPPTETQAPSQQEKNLARLQQMMAIIEQSPTKDDFEQAIKTIVEIVLRIERRNSDTVSQIENNVRNILSQIHSDSSRGISDLKGQVNGLFVGQKFQEMKAEIDARLALVRDGKDGAKGQKGDTGKQGRAGRDGSPDTPAQIRDKLEKLKGEDRLDASAIKGLENRLSKLERSRFVVGGNNMAGVVRAYDLSGSLDGATRTFSLPAFWRIISVHLSSFPSILRETTDYTFNANAMTITFTSAVPLSSIASGQSLIIIYAGA